MPSRTVVLSLLLLTAISQKVSAKGDAENVVRSLDQLQRDQLVLIRALLNYTDGKSKEHQNPKNLDSLTKLALTQSSSTVATLSEFDGDPLITANDDAVDPLKKVACEYIRGALRKENILKLVTGTYYYEKFARNWYASKEFCEKLGMPLASLETKFELETVYNNLTRNSFWLSGSEIGRKPGKFVWENGAEINATLWTPDEPNNFGANLETCVVLYSHKLFIGDIRCKDFKYYPLCEMPPQVSSCL